MGSSRAGSSPAAEKRSTARTAKRRVNGEGTLFEDTTRGGWVGQIYIDGRRRKVRAKTRVDAAAKLGALRRQADGGVIVDGNATVSDVLARWRDRDLASRPMSSSTRAKYLWALGQLNVELGTVRLRRLDVDTIEQALDRVASGTVGTSRGKPLGRASVSLVRDTLALALDFGMRRKMIATNPARLAVVTPTAKTAQKRRALDADDAARLWNALEGERLGPLFRTMLLTGLRPGEALGLCWDVVDLDRDELTVRRSVRLERGAARLVDELKTNSSYRTVALPTPAIDELRAQRRTVAEMKLAARVWVAVDPELVFPTVTGGPWNPKNTRDELARICADNRLPKVLPNELRHSCASILSERGVPLELIADLLGHTTTRMLAQTYRHRPRRAVDAAVDVMNGLFGATDR